MRDKVERKKYYRIEFTLTSPCIAGSGEDVFSDADIIRDGDGTPYIPGSALAGIARERIAPGLKEPERYFGMVPEAEAAARGVPARESRLIIYDARMKEKDLSRYHISRRDCVALDEWKTAKSGSKFEMEVLEPGVGFMTYLEQNFFPGDVDVAEEIALSWLNGKVRIGAKTTRGYGEIGDVRIRSMEFWLKEKNEVNRWLDFDMYAEEAWKDAPALCAEETEKNAGANGMVLSLMLELVGGISVRRYTTGDGSEVFRDYEQLTLHRTVRRNGEEDSVPVIPGTTWAGAFRHRIEQLAPGCEGDCFGFVDKKNKEKKKSLIRFSESRIEGAKPKVLFHNAIDRFSGGVIDNALFAEKTYYGGMTELKITFDQKIEEKLQKAFAAAVEDLNCGFLAVGGLTAIGRGIFKVRRVNAETVKEGESVYHMVWNALRMSEEGKKNECSEKTV